MLYSFTKFSTHTPSYFILSLFFALCILDYVLWWFQFHIELCSNEPMIHYVVSNCIVITILYLYCTVL